MKLHGLHQRRIGAFLIRLPEDVALSVREGGFKIVPLRHAVGSGCNQRQREA